MTPTYATWAPKPQDTIREQRALGVPTLALFATFLLAWAVCSLLLSFGLGFGKAALLGGGALGLFFAARVYFIGSISEWVARRTKASASVYELYKRIGLPNARPVKVAIHLDDYIIGTDEGLVEFADGVLEFHGLRTHFRFSRDRVEQAEYPFATGLRILGRENEMHVVAITPFERLDPLDDTIREHHFWKDYNAWMKSAPVEVKNEVLPPIRAADKMDIRVISSRRAWLDPILNLIVPMQILQGFLGDNSVWVSHCLVLFYLLVVVIIFLYGKRKRNDFYARMNWR